MQLLETDDHIEDLLEGKNRQEKPEVNGWFERDDGKF